MSALKQAPRPTEFILTYVTVTVSVVLMSALKCNVQVQHAKFGIQFDIRAGAAENSCTTNENEEHQRTDIKHGGEMEHTIALSMSMCTDVVVDAELIITKLILSWTVMTKASVTCRHRTVAVCLPTRCT